VGEHREAGKQDNPDERTQWLPYLVGIEQADVITCIEEPVAKPDPRSENETRLIEAAI
jgi:hypothetical protein